MRLKPDGAWHCSWCKDNCPGSALRVRARLVFWPLCREVRAHAVVCTQCTLCPVLKGAFKQTTDRKWVHVVCAMWCKYAIFVDERTMEPIDGGSHSPPRLPCASCVVFARQVCRRPRGALLCATSATNTRGTVSRAMSTAARICSTQHAGGGSA